MQRILVIGSSGSGKTTLARVLAQKFDLPVVSLDHLYWQPGWIETDQKIFADLVHKEIAKPQWVMDGIYKNTLEQRLKAADLVVFLDINRWICCWRIVKRRLIDGKEQAPGCPANVSWQLLDYVFRDFPTRIRPILVGLHQGSAHQQKWIHLQSQQQVKDWLHEVAV